MNLDLKKEEYKKILYEIAEQKLDSKGEEYINKVKKAINKIIDYEINKQFSERDLNKLKEIIEDVTY
ncbi:hypothetical protein [Mycoplasmopsis lipofaciens]|uniref:hypothetical protein n=1 Tax=Mycoplasmopsis lipofaciens TaxID=114884 RepID=UPI000481C647|nr:hypothetical protein [Mycoplasmopsis lipofaciens]